MIASRFTGDLALLLLVQSTACLGAGLAVSYALRRHPARAHQILLMAILAAVLMPALYVTARHYGWGLLASKAIVPSDAPALDGVRPLAADGETAGLPLLTPEPVSEPEPLFLEEPVAEAPASPAAWTHVSWPVVALAGWLTATTVLLMRLVLRFVLGLHLLRTAEPLETEAANHTVEQAKQRLGIARPVRIRCSESVRSPVVWCWGREPILLLQKAAVAHQERTDWTGVFCHELAHWQRRDHLTGLGAELLAALLPWHPLLWWTRGRLLALSEQACDDWVLATGHSGVDYAEVLLGLAAERQMAFLPTVIGKERTMNTRIRRIITDHGSDPRIGTRWAWLVGVLALGTTVSVAVAQPRPAGPEPRDAPPQGGFRQRQEVDGRNKPEVATERQALERLIQQLSRQAQEKEAALNRNRDLPAEERQVQQIELRLLDEQIAQMKRRLAAPRAEPTTKGELRESQGRRPPEQTLDFLRQSREDLARRGREVERELRELPEGQEERARGLKSELESIHNKMARIDKQMAESPRRPAEPKRAGAEEARREPQPRKQALVERQAGLREQIARLERQLQERKARGEGESPESRELLERLRGLRAELQTSPEGRPPKMQPPLTPVKPMMPEKSMGDRNLQGQVEELRGQMKELQGQMQRMQKLLEQMNQRGGTNEPQKRSMY